MAELPLTTVGPDPGLLSGPADLTQAALGEDELLRWFRENQNLVVEEDLPARRRVTLLVLVQFNNGVISILPRITEPCLVRLIDPADETTHGTRFRLKRERPAGSPFPVFVLRPIRPVDVSPKPQAGSGGPIDDLLLVVERGSSADLEMLLMSMQIEREARLAELRKLAEVHRDAVQNAVDIVQTKRIDFLERPQDAGIEGSIMAFVVAQIAGGAIAAVVGSVFEVLAVGVFALVGRYQRTQAKLAISQFIADRHASLESAILSLKKVQRTFVPETQRSLLKSKNRLQDLFKQRIAALKKDVEQAKLERRLLEQGLVEDAMARARDLRAQLKNPIENSEGGVDLVKGALVIDKAAEAVSDAMKEATQTRADAPVRSSALPLDVALKMEVQDYFDPWLTAAETSVDFLKKAQLTVRMIGTLPQEAVDEIIRLVALSGDLEAFEQQFSSLSASSINLRADITSFYELLLWLTLYRTRLSKMNTIVVPDATGNFRQPQKVLPKGDAGTMNLLKYLALRFFGAGTIKGEGADAELIFSDEELKRVFLRLETMCAQVFRKSGATSGGSDEQQVAITEALQTIRFSVVNYEKP